MIIISYAASIFGMNIAVITLFAGKSKIKIHIIFRKRSVIIKN